MAEYLVFGGTSEGREVIRILSARNKSAILYLATDYGQAFPQESSLLQVHRGRLDEEGMREEIRTHKPLHVIDATHPYADIVTQTIRAACEKEGATYLRVEREKDAFSAGVRFDTLEEMCRWLSGKEAIIFSTLGAKQVRYLTAVKGYKERLRLRILPFEEGLRACLEAGFPAKHIYCMQGPFSKEFNRAIFLESGARILITKDTGEAGGFREKVEAAKELGMEIGILNRPTERDGIQLTELEELLREDR